MDVRAAVKSAVRYPIMVVITLLAAMALAVLYVIPQFAVFYAKARVDLPLPTRMLIDSSVWVKTHGAMVLVFLSAAATAVIVLLRAPASRRKIDKMTLSLPVAGRLCMQIALARFCRILAMLIRNGVPIIKAMEVAGPVMQNIHLCDAVASARDRIEKGSTITEGLTASGAFPPMIMHLVAVGEKTGDLDNMLDFVVAQYDMEVRYGIKNLVTAIEPAVTVVIGIGVLFLALSIYLPIWNMFKVFTK
jgi:MSHA biogenesis protein MshG